MLCLKFSNSFQVLQQVQNQCRRFAAAGIHECGITHIQDEADYRQRVIANEAPVLVDFHATWCGPCKMLGPRLDKVMADYMDRVLLAKVDVDTIESIAMENKIAAVPTVIGIRHGKKVSEFTGLQEEAQIKKFIDDLCQK